MYNIWPRAYGTSQESRIVILESSLESLSSENKGKPLVLNTNVMWITPERECCINPYTQNNLYCVKKAIIIKVSALVALPKSLYLEDGDTVHVVWLIGLSIPCLDLYKLDCRV